MLAYVCKQMLVNVVRERNSFTKNTRHSIGPRSTDGTRLNPATYYALEAFVIEL